MKPKIILFISSLFLFIILMLAILIKTGVLGDKCANLTGIEPTTSGGWDANIDSAKDRCYFDRAISENKVTLCDKTGELKINCIGHVAANTKNASLCVGKFRDYCLNDVGELTKDESFCQMISSAGFRASCIQNVKSH